MYPNRPGTRGRDLELEAEAITNLQLRSVEAASCDMARFADRSGSPLGCDDLRPATARPGRPAAFEFKFDSDHVSRKEPGSGREGGCCESNQYLPPPKPERVRPTGPGPTSYVPPPPLPSPAMPPT